MKKILCTIAIASALFAASTVSAKSSGGNFSVGLGPVGNIFVVDSRPELDPGIGGYVFFDYRWSPQFSTQFGVVVTTEDGTGISDGDNGIEFLGIPTFDLKFYVLKEPSRWDPYALIGMGVYAVTEGTAKDGTTAVGIGANMGIGTDFYITESLSVGLAAIFRSIGLIDSTSGPNNGTALFPFSLMGNIAYHF
ncbi:MAG TPA: outer membrane beta-barrel protein [bacterium]|jgi:hypothetical protein|nr:porin family protein [Myxococcales bacterium]OQA58972.1 MAG: hypothetical protein BWY40_01355 [bacterium ADurb.Bin270]HPW45240.1 outer membrane beta-barrel protein [bacterium]HQC50296.1 outer membrane beta-barrel protein [bacterium]HQG13246.1 outer membrane beta-barrel protein [bacterium]